jgi:hypothetical protein
LQLWWPSAVANLPRKDAKTVNSFIMLVARSLWLERNARVFDNVRSIVALVVSRIVEEWSLWTSARRRGGFPGDIG